MERFQLISFTLLLLCLTLSACGGGGSSATPVTIAQTPEIPGEPKPDPPTQPDPPVEPDPLPTKSSRLLVLATSDEALAETFRGGDLNHSVTLKDFWALVQPSTIFSI